MPFTAGEQDWAKSYPLPLPGTLYGAIRSMILSKRDFHRFVSGDGYDDIGTPSRKGTLKLKYFTLAKSSDEGNVEFYFPLPANLSAVEETEQAEEDQQKGSEGCTKNFRIFATGLRGLKGTVVKPVSPVHVQSFFYTREDAESVSGYWINRDGLMNYLQAKELQSEDLECVEKFFISESKTGIARDRTTRTSKVGKLYRVDHHRFQEGISIVALVEGTEESLEGIFTLGGERRTATVQEINIDPVEKFDIPDAEQRFVVYLLTPAIFENTWYPQRICEELEKKGIRVNLVSANIPGYKVISGWDIQKKGPKTLYRAVPEGSVYVFEVTKGSVEDALKEFHCKNISEVNPDEGYGFALTGKI